jgi:DNA mismatch endonuclease (patch repair protein)
MADTVDKQTRSRIMAQVTGKNTKPEIMVRRLLWRMGFRYRLYDKYLAGKPDIVFTKKKKVIFVHGCFWHGHCGCKRAKLPESNAEYWRTKIQSNIERDAANTAKLQAAGWQVLILWECELKDMDELRSKLSNFLTEKEAK